MRVRWSEQIASRTMLRSSRRRLTSSLKIYTQLVVTFKRRMSYDQATGKAPRFLDHMSRFKNMVLDGHSEPRQLANILWRFARLSQSNSCSTCWWQHQPSWWRSLLKSMEWMPLNAQDLCSLGDLVVLQDPSPAVAHFLAAGSIMICAAARLNILLPKLKGNDLNIAVPSLVLCQSSGVPWWTAVFRGAPLWVPFQSVAVERLLWFIYAPCFGLITWLTRKTA